MSLRLWDAEQVSLLPLLFRIVAPMLVTVAALMQSGRWCYLCHAESTKECTEGTCQIVEYETHVDLESLHHVPDVDFGGGE